MCLQTIVIKEKAPDSLGVQEADKNWVDTLAAGLSDYAHIEKYRDEIKTQEQQVFDYLEIAKEDLE